MIASQSQYHLVCSPYMHRTWIAHVTPPNDKLSNGQLPRDIVMPFPYFLRFDFSVVSSTKIYPRLLINVSSEEKMIGSKKRLWRGDYDSILSKMSIFDTFEDVKIRLSVTSAPKCVSLGHLKVRTIVKMFKNQNFTKNEETFARCRCPRTIRKICRLG